MSEQLQGQFIPEETRTKRDAVVRPDDGLCCLCGQPREEGFRYLCPSCVESSMANAFSIEVAAAVVQGERRKHEQRVRMA